MESNSPKCDFRRLLGLKPGDELDGYSLTKDGVTVDLRATEAAFLAADAKGLVSGTLASQRDGSLAVIVGRNAAVFDDDCAPAHYPVAAEVLDEYLEYAVNALEPVALPVKVIAKDHKSQNLSGKLTKVVIDERGRASVVINEKQVLVRDLFDFRLVAAG